LKAVTSSAFALALASARCRRLASGAEDARRRKLRTIADADAHADANADE